MHALALASPVPANAVTTAAPVPGFAARYQGLRPNFPFETGTLGSTVGNGGSFTLPYPAGTTQAYGQAIQATDTRHMMKMGNANYYAAYDGSFSVSYESSQVRITNTSGGSWSGGSSWKLRLDRKSQLPAMDPTHGNPPSIPLPAPVAGSPIAANGDLGARAYDDFMGNVRPGPGGLDHQGQARPGTGNSSGALLA